MTNTIVLTKIVNGNLQCSALCIEADYEKLKDSERVFDIMHESVFRSLYASEYNRYVQSDLMNCVTIWLEQFYNDKKDFHTEDNCIFTDSYFIRVVNSETIHFTLYLGCGALEIARLLLYLQGKLQNTCVDIEINETTLFSDICSN